MLLQAIEGEVKFAIADLKPAAGVITFNLRSEHGPQDAITASRAWAISAALSGKVHDRHGAAQATKIGPERAFNMVALVSSCDVLDILGYVLVAVFERRLVHDHRFASGR
jgi:hypothetical protein